MKPLLLCMLLSIPLIGAEYYDRGKLKTLTPEPAPRVQASATSISQGSSVGTRWYRNEEGQRIGVNPSILIKWADPSQAAAVLDQFSLSGAEKISGTIWLVPVPMTMDIFDVTKRLYEHKAVEFAQPDMIKERRTR